MNCQNNEEKRSTTYWNIPVSRSLNESLESAIEMGWYRTKAEFIRDVVIKKLIELGFHSPRPAEGI